MLIAIVNGQTVEQVGDYQSLFPNTSFPASGPDAEFLAQNSAMGVTVFKPHDNKTQKLISVDPYIENNTVFTVAVADKTQEELDADTANVANQVRAQRNRLLADSDWTQVADAPVDKEAWATYRQELRDITSQEGFPYTVTYPTPPVAQLN